jgi:RNA recognition motif-containing protein
MDCDFSNRGDDVSEANSSMPKKNMSSKQPKSAITKPSIPAVFFGNLSYFCQEQHLRELAAPYGRIERVCVCRSDDQKKPLQYGFVTMSNRAETERLVDVFHGCLFMGRKLR